MLLITGSKGQLGTCLSKLLPEAVCADVDELDITNEDAVCNFVRKNNIDTIINCAAYTAVDKAEDDISLAEKINVLGITNLAKSGAKVIHISTDYVFDGTAHKPYAETDSTNPQSVYGKTKLDGENALFSEAHTATVIRTAWLYSEYGNNFLKTMLRLGSERKELGVVADQVGTPTYAGDLAEAIVALLPHIKEGTKEIYHFSNEGVCSWYDFATAIMELGNRDCKVNPISTKDYPARAARPHYSVLDKSKIKNTLGIKIPHWRESLKKCINQF